MRGGRTASARPVVSGAAPVQGKEKRRERKTMGSGAKIALVALLILMVVAVAKFVQNGKEDDGGPPPALTKKDAAGKDSKNANNPRLAPPKSVAGTPGTTTPSIPGRQTLPPTGGPASPVVKS